MDIFSAWKRPRLLLDAAKRKEAPDEHYSSGRMTATIDAGDDLQAVARQKNAVRPHCLAA
jgi:hypothetical protein